MSSIPCEHTKQSTHQQPLVDRPHINNHWWTDHTSTTTGGQSTHQQPLVDRAHINNHWWTEHTSTTGGQSTHQQPLVDRPHINNHWWTEHTSTTGGQSTHQQPLVDGLSRGWSLRYSHRPLNQRRRTFQRWREDLAPRRGERDVCLSIGDRDLVKCLTILQ